MNGFYYGTCAGLLLFTSLLQAEEHARDPSLEIFQKSGLAAQIETLPNTLSERLQSALAEDRHLKNLPATATRHYTDGLRSSFSVEKLSQSILIYLDSSFNLSEMEEVIQWLDSSNGSEFTRLEMLATRPESMAQMRRDLQQQNPDIPATRQQLIKRLNKVTRASDSTLMVMMTSRLAVELIKRRDHQSSTPLSVNAVIKEIGAERDELEAEALPDVIAGLHYTYRDASNESLQAYIHFAETSLGKRYHNAILGAYNSALIDASQKYGKTLLSAPPQPW